MCTTRRAACVLSCAAVAAAAAPVVTIDGLGAVRGTRRTVKGHDVDAYYGIRYGTAARFEEPVLEAAPWAGVTDCTKHGPTCPGSMCGAEVLAESEDCLNLDVYKTAGDEGEALHPVMVWIHGGSYLNGCAQQFELDTWVSNAGGAMVAVGVEYRMGAFGFLGGERVRSGAMNTTGNWGLLDQRLALDWVRRHIASFGGDPQRVTILGQSAGAASVSCHLASPLSAGLFQGAVSQSGLGSDWAVNHMAASEKTFAATLLAAGCVDVACLKRLPMEALNVVTAAVTAAVEKPGALFAYAPTVDGVALPLAPTDAFRTGQFNNVPVLAGTTRDELGVMKFIEPIPTTSLEFDVFLAPFLKHPLKSLRVAEALYTNGSYAYPQDRGAYTPMWWAVVSAITDAAFTCGTKRALRDLVAQNATVYSYYFNHTTKSRTWLPSDGPRNVFVGHGEEMIYTFDCPLFNVLPCPLCIPDKSCTWHRPDEGRLAGDMAAFWIHFATHGRPGGVWDAPQPRGRDVVFAIDTAEGFGGNGFKYVEGLRAQACAFWEDQEPPH
eukprot:TRINITY_DN17535_c0_g1_i1.p1 TRINITY_DN17535_c0_g1~~TRINITY_DN17535_c0_g1_i1.p1  ORF type:complete len:550 (+),score=189.69 TRINITY_DN17535_c0_g1_i1:36-1685(+)